MDGFNRLLNTDTNRLTSCLAALSLHVPRSLTESPVYTRKPTLELEQGSETLPIVIDFISQDRGDNFLSHRHRAHASYPRLESLSIALAEWGKQFMLSN